MDREDGLERCLRSLMESPELQVSLSARTQETVDEALQLVAAETDRASLDELLANVLYIVEQVESIRAAQDELVRKFDRVLIPRETQKSLF